MRESTSGVLVTAKKDMIEIGYVDYGVSEFGGSDFECFYYLTGENAVKFKKELSKLYKGSLEQKVKSAFGENFSDSLFCAFCKKHNIEYSKSTWTSGGF